jgi:two-component system, NarL family, invasion response regulator UvrY
LAPPAPRAILAGADRTFDPRGRSCHRQARYAVGSVRVLTVDDHPVFRAAAHALVDATAGFEIVGEAETGADGVAAAFRLRPDVVLLDVRLPDMDGYEAARRIAPNLPAVVICLVSTTKEALEGDSAARCGAVAFVRKQDLRPKLLQELWATHGTGGPG